MYEYEVDGKKYMTTLCFNNDYPVSIKVYYDPKKPGKCIAENEVTESLRIQQGCLVTILATFISMAIVFNILERLF